MEKDAIYPLCVVQCIMCICSVKFLYMVWQIEVVIGAGCLAWFWLFIQGVLAGFCKRFGKGWPACIVSDISIVHVVLFCRRKSLAGKIEVTVVRKTKEGRRSLLLLARTGSPSRWR
jgi:hypothetical protein